MTYKQKIHLARKMMTQNEIDKKISPFDCKGWLNRAKLRQRVVVKKVDTEEKKTDIPVYVNPYVKPQLKWYQRIWRWIKYQKVVKGRNKK